MWATLKNLLKVETFQYASVNRVQKRYCLHLFVSIDGSEIILLKGRKNSSVCVLGERRIE